MSDVVSWLVEVSIKSGQLDNFKALVEELVQWSQEDPKTLAFRAKRILQEHLAVNENDFSMSGVATFFFQIFYIQYKINRLIPE